LQDFTQVVVKVSDIWLEPDHLAVTGFGLVKATLIPQDNTQVVMGLRIFRFVLQRTPEEGLGLI
jgi:hypothetical protein